MMSKSPDPEILIRTATKEDVPQLLKLYTELMPEEPPIDEKKAAANWEQAVKRGAVYYVAADKELVVATCFVVTIPNLTRQGSPLGLIENVVTAADYRRGGIGRRLITAAIDYAREQGCYKVMLQSGYQRKEAHLFYESMGFDGNSKRAFEIRF